MNFDELQKLLLYIEQNNSWLNQYEINMVDERCRPIVKYVNFSVDTRTSDVWRVTFHLNAGEVHFDDGSALHPKSLKDDIYAWLNTPDPEWVQIIEKRKERSK